MALEDLAETLAAVQGADIAANDVEGFGAGDIEVSADRLAFGLGDIRVDAGDRVEI
ncbi:MAG: hypothetical protein AAGE83_05085 [Pseudomonadota bacterium]